MPLLQPTGTPRIVLNSGEIIDLPLPDSGRFMRGDYVDESIFNTRPNRMQTIIGKRILRPRFDFGYSALDASTAATLVRVFEGHTDFTFIPRTLNASDPVTAVERAYTVRFVSDMPFVMHPKGFIDIDVSFESTVETTGAGVAGVAGTVYFTTDSQNAGAGSFAAGSVILANRMYQRNPDGTLIELIDFSPLVPNAFALSQSSGMLVVGFTNGEINTYDLAGYLIAQLLVLGDSVESIITFNSGTYTNQIFYIEEVSGTDRDVKRLPITGGTPQFVYNDTSHSAFISPWITRQRILSMHNAIGKGVLSHFGNGTLTEAHYIVAAATNEGVIQDQARRLIFFKNASQWSSIPDTGSHTTKTDYGFNSLSRHWHDKNRDRIYGRDTNLNYQTSPVIITKVEESFLISGVLRNSTDFGNYGVRDARVWQP